MLTLPSVFTRSAMRDELKVEFNAPALQTLLARHDLTQTAILHSAFRLLMWRFSHTCVTASAVDGDRVDFLTGEDQFSGDERFEDVFEIGRLLATNTSLPVVVFTDTSERDELDSADLVIRVEPAQPIGIATFDSAVYSEECLREVFSYLNTLLDSLASDPLVDIGTAAIMTDEVKNEIVRSWCGEPAVYDGPLLLHRRFEEQAKKTPDAVALEFELQTLTYSELDRLANAIAQRLVDLGVEGNAAVALHGERSLEFFISMFGVLKAGCSFLHLDLSLPEFRNARMCELADVRVVLHGEEPLGALIAADRKTVGWNTVIAEIGSRNVEPPAVSVDEEAIACIQFTSGSTGEPKGVLRSHRMAMNGILAEQVDYPLRSSDRVLMKSPVAQRECIWPLLVGATGVIARPRGEQDDRYLIDLIRERDITSASIIPSVLAVLLRFSDLTSCRSLRRLQIGGEALSMALEEKIRSTFKGEVTYTLGLSEVDYVCTRSSFVADTANPVLGRPAGVRMYVCDKRGQLLPPGITGELYLSGPTLSSGYLARPDLTAERFVPDPYSGKQEVMFRTGDIVRFRSDGQVTYLGRGDHQIKVRGQRIEPAEIDTRLRTHEQIADVAVVGISDEDQGSRLVAYIVPEGDPPHPDALRRFLAATLPSFMIPSVFVPLDRLPQLPNGKLDRSQLPRPAATRPQLENAYVEPKNELQRAVADVWADVLGIDRVGVFDAYTDLGGDSLRVMVLRAALEDRLGKSVSVTTLFECPTVDALCLYLEQSSDTERQDDDGLARAAAAKARRLDRMRKNK